MICMNPAPSTPREALPRRLSEDDEVTLHLHDTLLAGDGLCREEAVRVLVEEGPKQIHQLIDWGMRFDRNGTKLAFTREGAHSRSRILHAHGDSTGSEILRALMAKARTLPSIQLHPHTFATELVVEGGKVCGVSYLDAKSFCAQAHSGRRRIAGHRRAWATSTRKPPTLPWPAATAWPWLTGPARC